MYRLPVGRMTAGALAAVAIDWLQRAVATVCPSSGDAHLTTDFAVTRTLLIPFEWD
ncbi:hypothetical protein MOKP45_46980 [Mycobacterium avium subsp. hominissuis]